MRKKAIKSRVDEVRKPVIERLDEYICLGPKEIKKKKKGNEEKEKHFGRSKTYAFANGILKM